MGGGSSKQSAPAPVEVVQVNEPQAEPKVPTIVEATWGDTLPGGKNSAKIGGIGTPRDVKLCPAAEEAVQDFIRCCKMVGNNNGELSRENFYRVMEDIGYPGDKQNVYDELCQLCSTACGRIIRVLDAQALRGLYASEPYTEVGKDNAGSALIDFVSDLFDQYDKDGSGEIDRDEAKECIAAMLGEQESDSLPPDFDMDEFIDNLDKNGDRTIDKQEFISGLLNLTQGAAAEPPVLDKRCPKGINVIALDPAHCSADAFVKQLEDWAIDHPVNNHHLLENLSSGCFEERTAEIVHRFMKSYKHFNKDFVPYVTSLKDLLQQTRASVNSVAIMKENEEEENGNYDQKELHEWAAANNIAPEVVNGIRHTDLFDNCMNAIGKHAAPAAQHDDATYAAAAQKLVDAFRITNADPKYTTAQTKLASLYFGSELIVPQFYGKILQAMKIATSLDNSSLAFFLLHVEMDKDHATLMREVVIKHADTMDQRKEMVAAVKLVMDARAEFLSNLVVKFYTADEKGTMHSGKLYDAQSDNWVRKEATCLSDFTGRPVVFDMCKDHVEGASVLDVGCGEGYVARKLVAQGAKSIVGVDISDGMIKKAQGMAGPNESYLTADATRLRQALESNPITMKVMPGADMAVGCFDMAVGVFVYNYVTIHEMNRMTEDVFSLLKPGGHYVFSVPHPFMIFTHGNEDCDTFSFRTNGLKPSTYFSLKDTPFGGTIKTTEGRHLNVKMMFKTISDYTQMLRKSGFEIVNMHEARVLPEHVEHNPQFFHSIKDSPLHLVFKVRKPDGSSNLSAEGVLDLLPKKIIWTPTATKNIDNSMIMQVPTKVQNQLFEVVSRCYSQGVTGETFEMNVHATAKELSLVQGYAEEVRDRLLIDVGAILIRGLDKERYGGYKEVDKMTTQMKLAYYIICSFIGQVDAGARGRLFDVKNAKLDVKADNVLFSVSNSEAGWHTDGASRDRVYDVVSLLCCVPATTGGEFKIANGVNALEALKLRMPKWLMYELYRPLPRDVLENGSGKGAAGMMMKLKRSAALLRRRIKLNSYPVYVDKGEHVRFRYMRFWIETAHTKCDWPMSPLLRVAMDMLDKELDDGCCFEQCMASGDMVFANNMVVAHARNSFHDGDDKPPRHKVRAWMQLQKAQLLKYSMT